MEQKPKATISVDGTCHCHHQDHRELLAWVKKMHDKVRSATFGGELTPSWKTLPPPKHIHMIVFPGSIEGSHTDVIADVVKQDREIWFGDCSIQGAKVSEIGHDWVLCHELSHCLFAPTEYYKRRFLRHKHEDRLPEQFADKVAGIITGYSRELFYAELDR